MNISITLKKFTDGSESKAKQEMIMIDTLRGFLFSFQRGL